MRASSPPRSSREPGSWRSSEAGGSLYPPASVPRMTSGSQSDPLRPPSGFSFDAGAHSNQTLMTRRKPSSTCSRSKV